MRQERRLGRRHLVMEVGEGTGEVTGFEIEKGDGRGVWKMDGLSNGKLQKYT